MPPRLIDIAPALTQALIDGLKAQGELDLAHTVLDLVIVEPCECRSPTCGSFYTQPKPAEAFGRGHRNILIYPLVGTLILDVVVNTIHYVEVLDWDVVRHQIAGVFPGLMAPRPGDGAVVDIRDLLADLYR